MVNKENLSTYIEPTSTLAGVYLTLCVSIMAGKTMFKLVEEKLVIKNCCAYTHTLEKVNLSLKVVIHIRIQLTK